MIAFKMIDLINKQSDMLYQINISKFTKIWQVYTIEVSYEIQKQLFEEGFKNQDSTQFFKQVNWDTIYLYKGIIYIPDSRQEFEQFPFFNENDPYFENKEITYLDHTYFKKIPLPHGLNTFDIKYFNNYLDTNLNFTALLYVTPTERPKIYSQEKWLKHLIDLYEKEKKSSFGQYYYSKYIKWIEFETKLSIDVINGLLEINNTDLRTCSVSKMIEIFDAYKNGYAMNFKEISLDL